MKLADLIPFRRRRTISRYVDDKAVQDFTAVAKDQGLDLDYDRTERLAALILDDRAPDQERIEQINKLVRE